MTPSMCLQDLIAPWLDLDGHSISTLSVTRLVLDSRKISPNDTFIAVVGHTIDGRQFIDSATQAGANLVLAQACEQYLHGSMATVNGVLVIYLADLNQHLSQLASRLYRSKTNTLIGVTGTNGKTTITQLIAQWIDLLGEKAAVLGTTGNGFLNHLQPAANTTGNAIEVQETLYQLAQQGARYTALEVSSHGLVQGRVQALKFAVGVFSNLSRDHLDYHGTMEEYAKAKLSLFTAHHCQHAVINADDAVGASWLAQLKAPIAVSLKQQPQCAKALWASSVSYSDNGISLTFDGYYGQGELSVPLIGEFNASNLLLAFAAMLTLGFDKQALMTTASQLQPVLGRMELFQAPNRAKIVVDYAHTPDALEKALLALRVHCQGQLWAIFGCGGDRDKGKRPMMAEIAERCADKVILTDDNPRSEKPADIVQDMVAGLEFASRAHVEHNRYAAVQYALQHADQQDIILLAGKGHEDYQVMAHQTIHYSDRETAQTLLEISA